MLTVRRWFNWMGLRKETDTRCRVRLAIVIRDYPTVGFPRVRRIPSYSTSNTRKIRGIAIYRRVDYCRSTTVHTNSAKLKIYTYKFLNKINAPCNNKSLNFALSYENIKILTSVILQMACSSKILFR